MLEIHCIEVFADYHEHDNIETAINKKSVLHVSFSAISFSIHHFLHLMCAKNFNWSHVTLPKPMKRAGVYNSKPWPRQNLFNSFNMATLYFSKLQFHFSHFFRTFVLHFILIVLYLLCFQQLLDFSTVLFKLSMGIITWWCTVKLQSVVKFTNVHWHWPFRNSTGNWGEFEILTNR